MATTDVMVDGKVEESTPEAVEIVEIEFDELGRFEGLSMCCNIAL